MASTTLFNVAVGGVVRHWILLTVEYGSVIQDRLRHAVGRSLDMFYADDGFLGSREPEWFQDTLDILKGLFRYIGLAGNVANSKTMNCHTGAIRLGMSQESLGRHRMGEGATYRDIPSKRVP